MTMEAELQREVTRRQYEQRKGVIQSALNSSLENDKAIEAVLYTKVILPFERDRWQCVHRAYLSRPHCNKIWIYIFTEKKLRGLSPNFHIHVSVKRSVDSHVRSTYFPAAE